MTRKFAYLPKNVYDQNDKKIKSIWLKHYWRVLDSNKEGLFWTDMIIYKQNQIAFNQQLKRERGVDLSRPDFSIKNTLCKQAKKLCKM